MAHPYDHARSSAMKFGGRAEDYVAVHSWFDESKKMYCHWRHRALRHHAEGIFMAESIFGVTITNSDGKKVPTRLVGEQHVREDLGFIPSVQDWLSNLGHAPWMTRGVAKLRLDDREAHTKGKEKSSCATTRSSGTATTKAAGSVRTASSSRSRSRPSARHTPS